MKTLLLNAILDNLTDNSGNSKKFRQDCYVVCNKLGFLTAEEQETLWRHITRYWTKEYIIIQAQKYKEEPLQVLAPTPTPSYPITRAYPAWAYIDVSGNRESRAEDRRNIRF